MEKQLNEREFDVREIYTPLSVAKKEIEKRWRDKELRKKVEAFLHEVPEVFREKPKAIIFRNIATPNLEMQLASEYASIMDLDLVVVEYTADKFCTRNRDKLYLGKMMFSSLHNKANVVAKKNVISIKEDDNKCFTEIKTLWGEDFVSFHHRILKASVNSNIQTFDASIFKKMGLSPYEIYLKIFGLCLGNCVLLENFLVKSDKSENKFDQQVIFPAFSFLKKKFGLNPLVVPLVGVYDEADVCCQYYSDEIQNHINENLI